MKYYQNLITIKILVKSALPDSKLTAIFWLSDRTLKKEVGIRVAWKNNCQQGIKKM